MKTLHKQRGFLGDLVGGLLGWAGAEQQGDDMIQNTQIANAFSAEQHNINRQFQERMANTAYQRATGDMMNAGLNPMLAYSQGGASSPTGGAATGIAAGTVNKLGAIAPSAANIAQIAETKARTENIQADTANKRAEQIPDDAKPTTWDANLKRAAAQRDYQQVSKLIEETNLTMEQKNRVMQEIKNAVTHNKLQELNIPRAIAEARAHDPDSKFGKYHPYGDATFRGINSAAQLFNMFKGR